MFVFEFENLKNIKHDVENLSIIAKVSPGSRIFFCTNSFVFLQKLYHSFHRNNSRDLETFNGKFV